MHCLIIQSYGKSGGRRVIENLSILNPLAHLVVIGSYASEDSLFSCIPKSVLYSSRTKSRFFWLRAYWSYVIFLLSLSSKDRVIIEGFYPSLIASVIRVCFKRYFLVVRLGTYYVNLPNKVIWKFIYYLSDRVVSPLYQNKDFIPESKFFYSLNPLLVETMEGSTNFPYFVIAGRAVNSKMLHDSIDIAGFLNQHFKDHNTLLYIDKASSTYYEQILSKCKSLPFITIRDFSDDFLSSLSRSKGIINASIHEGFSYVSYEAGVFGVPTISMFRSEPSGQIEFIERTGYGYIMKSKHDLAVVPFLKSWDYNSRYKHDNSKVFDAYFN